MIIMISDHDMNKAINMIYTIDGNNKTPTKMIATAIIAIIILTLIAAIRFLSLIPSCLIRNIAVAVMEDFALI